MPVYLSRHLAIIFTSKILLETASRYSLLEICLLSCEVSVSDQDYIANTQLWNLI